MKKILYIALLLIAGAGCIAIPARAHAIHPPGRPDTREVIRAADAARIRALLRTPSESIRWQPCWVIKKWHSEKERKAGKFWPDEVVVVRGNQLLTAGITRMWNLFTAAGGQGFNATHARIGAGDGTTAVTAADTDLSAAAGSTHRWFQLVDGAPSVSGATCTFTSTFGSSDGNFHWQEIGTDQGTASSNAVTAVLLNRKLADLGTKTAGASWTASEPISLAWLNRQFPFERWAAGFASGAAVLR